MSTACAEENRSRAGSLLAIGGGALVLAVVACAFFWPWLKPRNFTEAFLRRYAPLTEGGARLSAALDAEGRPVSWISSNEEILPPVSGVATVMRDVQRAALGRFFQEPGEKPLSETDITERLQRRGLLYESRSVTLAADGKVSTATYLSVRTHDGDFLIGVHDSAQSVDVIFDPPLRTLPGTLRQGTSWEQSGKRRAGSSEVDYTYRSRLLGFGRVSTKAGRFEECLEVEAALELSSAGKSLLANRSVYRLAPGHGVVDSESFDPAGQRKEHSIAVADRDFCAPALLPKAPLLSPAPAKPAAGALELSRVGTLRGGFEASASTVPAMWIPTEPPLVLSARQSGSLTAFQASGDGAVVWQFRPGGTIYGAPAWDAERGHVLFGASDKRLYCLDARGLFLWNFPTGDNVATRPLIVGGTVIFGSEDRGVYGVDATSGKLKWRFETGAPVASSPALAAGLAVVGSDDGNVYALEPETGRLRWKCEGEEPIETPIAADDAHVFAATHGGDLLALDAASGQKLWSAHLGGPASGEPAIAQDRVFVIEWGRLTALDLATGRQLWQTPESDFTGAPVLDGDSVVVAVSGGAIQRFAFDGTPGEKWALAASGNPLDAAAGFRFGPSAGGGAFWLADTKSIVRRLGPAAPAGPKPLRPAWMKRFSDEPYRNNFLNLTPVPWRDRAVIVGSGRDILLADPATGAATRAGTFGENGSPVFEPVLAGDLLLTILGSELFATHLPDGAPRWHFTAPGTGLRPPSVGGETILWMRQLDSAKGVLLALDAATGQVRWQREFPGSSGLGGAVALGELAITSTPPAAFRLSDGEPRWTAAVSGNPMGGPALSADGQTLFIGVGDPKTNAGRLAAIATADGAVRWEAALPVSTLHPLEHPWPSGEVLVVPLWDGSIAGVDLRSGAPRWHHQPSATRLGAISVENSRVWFMQQNLAVIGLDAATGDPAFRFALDIDLSSVKTFAPRPVAIGGRLIAPLTLMLLGLELPVVPAVNPPKSK